MKIDLEEFSKIISGKKKILTKEEQYEFEANYGAMCLLLPESSFLSIVEVLGGLKKVNSCYEDKETLAHFYKVEHKLIEIRINDLLSQAKQGKKLKKIKF